MGTRNEKILNVPNVLSAYRLLVWPLVMYMAVTGRENTFAVLICVSLVTDVLDGLLARMLKQVTVFGAALDYAADLVTYIAAIYGLFVFKYDVISHHYWLLIVFIAVLLLSVIIALIRFRTVRGMHLYSCVVAAYLQGLFFFLLFCGVFSPLLFYISVGLGVLGNIEKSIILFIIPEFRSGIRGLYWMLRAKG